jgi:hypothetical protein
MVLLLHAIIMLQLIHQKEEKQIMFQLKMPVILDVEVPKFSKSSPFNQSNLINVNAGSCRLIVLLSL